MNTTTAEKRAQFQAFIQQLLVPDTAVQGVVAIGSLATGQMSPQSDIDAILFLDPFDYFVAPAEAIWYPPQNTFHSIFTADQTIQRDGLALDFVRLDWSQWAAPEFAWPEGRRAELRAGWIAFDRNGRITPTIAQHTAYPDTLRLSRLDQALIGLDQHLAPGTPEANWPRLGPLIAHDRLEAAYDNLVAALFAVNWQWRVWRNREMTALLQLPWQPPHFTDRLLLAANAPGLDYDGYMTRTANLRSLMSDLLTYLIDNGDYSHAPIDQAFMRQHDEPGRAWNMTEWNKLHMVRQMTLTGANDSDSLI